LQTHILPGDGALVAFIRPIVGYLAAKSGSDNERRTAFGHEIPAANEHIADIGEGGLKGSLQQLGEPVTIGWS